MRTSNTRVRKFSLIAGKIMMVLVFVSMIGGICIAPAFGQGNGRHGGYYYTEHGRREYYQPPRHYYHPAPVYAPPPVVYYPAPYQSPGISLVFPINIR